MRSIEVLDRNGAHPVTITAPLGHEPVLAATLVQLVCQFIVRGATRPTSPTPSPTCTTGAWRGPYGFTPRSTSTRASARRAGWPSASASPHRHPDVPPRRRHRVAGARLGVPGDPRRRAFAQPLIRIINGNRVVFHCSAWSVGCSSGGAAAARRASSSPSSSRRPGTVGRAGDADDRARQFVVLARDPPRSWAGW